VCAVQFFEQQLRLVEAEPGLGRGRGRGQIGTRVCGQEPEQPRCLDRKGSV
jgi:hypothetical protein